MALAEERTLMPEPLGSHYEPLKRRSICETFEAVRIEPFGKGLDLLGYTGDWERLEDWLVRQGNLTQVPGRGLVLRNCRIRLEWDDRPGEVSGEGDRG